MSLRDHNANVEAMRVVRVTTDEEWRERENSNKVGLRKN